MVNQEEFDKELAKLMGHVCDNICTRIKGLPEEEAEEICAACECAGPMNNLIYMFGQNCQELASEKNKTIVKKIEEIAEDYCVNACEKRVECMERLDKGEKNKNCPFRKLV